MPRYRIERYEIHTSQFEVEASNKAEAVKKVLTSEAGDFVDDGVEFIEMCDAMGLPRKADPELFDSVRRLGCLHKGATFLPSIRAVEEVDD